MNNALLESFSALDDEQLDSLVWHVKNKTPIFCGPGSENYYTDIAGHG